MVQVRQVIAGTPPVTGVSNLSNQQDVNDSDKQNDAALFWNTDTQKHEYYILAGFNKDSAQNQYSFSPDELDIQNLTVTDSATIAYATISQGSINGVNIGADSAGTGAFTTLSATSGFSIAGLTFPTTDGTSGQALVTDGAGNITFAFAGDSSGVVVNSMADLTDVIATEATLRANGSYLRYDSADGRYEPSDFDSDALAAALAGISFTDAGGLGSFTFSNGSGTYTGPSNADIRSLFSVSGDLAYDSATGQFSYTDAASTVYTQSNFDSDLGTKTTDNLTEGSTNLYYTQSRADSDALEVFNVQFALKDADDLPAGSTNFYYTEGKFNTSLGTKTTADLAEGSNLYYTTARADSAATALVTRAFVKALLVDLDDVTDNSATTTNAITVGNVTTTGGVLTHDVSTTSITSASNTLVDNTAHGSDFTSIEYLLQANNDSAGEAQISKILVAYDKTNVSSTEYGTVFTGDSDLGTYTVDVSGDNIRLFFQRRPSNTITLRTTKTIIQ